MDSRLNVPRKGELCQNCNSFVDERTVSMELKMTRYAVITFKENKYLCNECYQELEEILRDILEEILRDILEAQCETLTS